MARGMTYRWAYPQPSGTQEVVFCDAHADDGSREHVQGVLGGVQNARRIRGCAECRAKKEAKDEADARAPWMVQAIGDWGGVASKVWGPGVMGIHNGTGKPDIEASTFSTSEQAKASLKAILRVARLDGFVPLVEAADAHGRIAFSFRREGETGYGATRRRDELVGFRILHAGRAYVA